MLSVILLPAEVCLLDVAAAISPKTFVWVTL